jgi:adenosylmethionine-8-amino-7-oxononanoate aminotransferase
MFDFFKKHKKMVQSPSNNVSENKEEELAAVLAAAIAASDDEELVAVIAAAVASCMGVGIPDIKIKSIKRIPQTSSPWARMARMEQLFSRL